MKKVLNIRLETGSVNVEFDTIEANKISIGLLKNGIEVGRVYGKYKLVKDTSGEFEEIFDTEMFDLVKEDN